MKKIIVLCFSLLNKNHDFDRLVYLFVNLFVYSSQLCIHTFIHSFSFYLFLSVSMRPSLSKSDNALSSLTSVINGRFKRHHSIDDDYPGRTDNEKFRLNLSTDHRVPNTQQRDDIEQEISFQKSMISSEIMVCLIKQKKKKKTREISFVFLQNVVDWFSQLDDRYKEKLLRELVVRKRKS